MRKRFAMAMAVALAVALAACGGLGGEGAAETGGTLVPVVVGASSTPHGEILEFVKGRMADMGYDLRIVEFEGYVMPNQETENGDLDANFFQHLPHMEDFNEKNGTHLVAVFPVHFEPFGLYPGKVAALSALQDGGTIAVPGDATNEDRALRLLEAAGLIKLGGEPGMPVTVNDIVDNQKNLGIMRVSAESITEALPEVDMAVINGNFALEAGLNAGADAIAVEDRESIGAVNFANCIVVKEGNEGDAGILALINALNSADVRDFINESYEGGVVPVF